MKRVVISDLHLGNCSSNEGQLLNFLSEIECDQLILAGDIIDFIRIPMFSDLTSQIFKIIDNFQGEIIYIVGNHDIPLKALVNTTLFGIQFKDFYEFIDNNKKIRIEHGDQYEKGIVHHLTVMKVISIFQNIIESIFNIDLLSAWVKFRLKRRKLFNIWDMIVPEKKEDIDVLIVGHTHTPEVIIWIDEVQAIKTYINVGDWVQHTTYVTIENGITRLKSYGGSHDRNIE